MDRIYSKNNTYLVNNLIYQNYHKHSIYTNVIMIDSCAYPEDYAKRAVELNHGIISSVEHGYQGRYIESYELAKQYNLKFLFGVEAYFVFDRTEKDNTNAHMCLLAKNENGRKAINRILSEASLTGFYYRPRIDYELLMSLPSNDVWITSACLGGINKYTKENEKSEKLINVWKEKNHIYSSPYEMLIDEIHKKFEDNFYLEVQAHNTDAQKQLNSEIIKLSKKYNIEIIAGVDSHYIYEDDAWKREYLQKSSGIFLDDEQGWYMDYPDGKVLFERFKRQGILQDDEILIAMDNTNIFLKVEEYTSPIFNHEMKMPSAPKYKNMSQEEKQMALMKIVKERWDEVKKEIPEEEHAHYMREIAKELDIIFKINHADYFLLNYEIIKEAVENRGGMITFSGRGCVKEGALIPTEQTLKKIEDVTVGDKVISSDGKFHKVLNTYKYDINEPLIQIIHDYGTNTYNPTVFTKEHKVLVHRNEKNFWIEAQDVQESDYVCCPKIKNVTNNYTDFIDLNDYNIFGFDYDDEYIYEYNSNIGLPYKYSPTDVSEKIGCSKSLIENLVNGKIKDIGIRKKDLKKKFFNYVPFKTFEEYCNYIKKFRTTKIKRYIKNDYFYNVLIGLLFGDGCHRYKKHTISLAFNSENSKDKINRKIFEDFCNDMGFNIYENNSEKRKLTQLTFTSFIYSEYFHQELFDSKMHYEKKFNNKLFYQKKQNLKGLKYGLWLADGSDKDGRICFDNTSLSLINAYKILSMLCEDCGVCSLTKRKEHIDKRGYHNKESYKIRYPKNSLSLKKEHCSILQDDNFWYLKVREVKNIEAEKISVYDFTIEGTHDYLLNNMIVHNSGPSFYVNHLLGFTQIDRISSPITLYPERFLSTSRMTAGSLADIDFNCGNTPVFEEAQKYIMGEEHAYPMIAYGTMKPKAAWKMYCRAVDVDFEIANTISSKIDEYETDLKYWDEESGEEKPNVYDYIPEELREAFDGSKEFLGIVDSASRHPCFVGETLINTETGYKKIKDIQIGEKVLSHDGKYHEVLEVMINKIDDDLLNIIAYDENLCKFNFITTKNHPILTDVSAIYEFESNYAFVPAMLLKQQDSLYSPEKKKFIINKIKTIKGTNEKYVYNLKVNITNTYTVTTNNIVVHNCGNILYSDNIKEEFGIVRLKSKGGRETIVACCDGKWCEKYLMLKNDLLTVACVKLNYLLYDRVGLPHMSLNKLLEECKNHPEVWDIYEHGYVVGLNQVEKPSTQRKVMKYKPKNVSELSALIAGIRPAFKSLIEKLINREHFEYGISTLDKLLQTEELPESFILYQEQIMKILSFAGIPMGDCYTVIKSISKKRFEKIMHYKEQFMEGMKNKLIEEENIDKKKAEEIAKTIWGIIEDASAYGFNSSHSLSVSFDSLLAAYFKALYPYEFYEVYLNLQMERADKAKALLAKKEMKEAFGISVLPMRFRQDNRKFVAVPEKKALFNCLKSIKGFGDKVGEEFYKIKDIHFDNFVEFLRYIDMIKKNKVDSKEYNSELPSGFAVNGSQIETLITLNYFEEFGCNYKLLKIKQLYDIFSSRKTINKNIIDFEEGYVIIDKVKRKIESEIFKKYIGKETKSTYKELDMAGYINEISNLIPNKSLDLLEQLKFERELLEFPIYQNTKLPNTWYYVLGFKTYGDKVSTPYLVLYSLVNGDLVVCSINQSKLFRDNPFGIYSIIDVKNFKDVIKKKKIGEKKYVPTNETKKVIAEYEVVIRNEKEELQVLEAQQEKGR